MAQRRQQQRGQQREEQQQQQQQQQRRRRSVCLFGLSADPPTGEGGHVGVVKALSDLNEFDEIRVLPVYQHQFAIDLHHSNWIFITFKNKRKRLLPFDHRYSMCKLAFEQIPRVVVSDCEKRCYEKLQLTASCVGTADLLDMLLLEEASTTDFTFAMGADTFMDLTDWKWKRSKQVFELLEGRIIAFARPMNQISRHHFKELEHRVETTNTSMQQLPNKVRLLQVQSLQAISSSMIRPLTTRGELENLVSPNVLDYIVENKLYGFEASVAAE